MAESNCPKCGSTRFEMVHAKNLEGTTRSVLFVQCATCGAVVGTLDFMNLSVQAGHVKEDVERFIERFRKSFER